MLKQPNCKIMRSVYYIFSVAVVFLLSCTGKTVKDEKITIVMPGKVELYNPFMGEKLPNPLLTKSKYRLYTLIDASCASCFAKLRKWNEFQVALAGDSSVCFIPVCHTKDNFEILKYHFESDSAARLNVPLVLDLENKFVAHNAALVDSYGQLTALTNNKNEVLLKGDPLENKTDREKFLDQIKKNDRLIP